MHNLHCLHKGYYEIGTDDPIEEVSELVTRTLLGACEELEKEGFVFPKTSTSQEKMANNN